MSTDNSKEQQLESLLNNPVNMDGWEPAFTEQEANSKEQSIETARRTEPKEMDKDQLINAGFKESDDPQFPYEYDISSPDQEEPAHEGKPALLFDVVIQQFCVTDGDLIFIYFNAESPEAAVEWANQITLFEPN